MVHAYVKHAAHSKPDGAHVASLLDGETHLCLVTSMTAQDDRFEVEYVTPEGEVNRRMLSPTNYVFYPDDMEVGYAD